MNETLKPLSAPECGVSKIASVTLAFWLMKILATTLGETAGDFLSMTLGLGYYKGLGITFAALAIVLAFQIGLPKFRPLLFWTAIIATTTAGTEISDFMDRSLGLGYVAGSAILFAGLLATLGLWWNRIGNLKVDPLVRKDAELYFWVAVLFSNSLGTVFGDFLVDDAGLTFIQGALVTAAVILVVAGLHHWRTVSDTGLFWIAFIFTRPFGATFGDLLTKPIENGGLNLPREYASLATLALLLIILYISSPSPTRTESAVTSRGKR